MEEPTPPSIFSLQSSETLGLYEGVCLVEIRSLGGERNGTVEVITEVDPGHLNPGHYASLPLKLTTMIHLAPPSQRLTFLPEGQRRLLEKPFFKRLKVVCEV